MYTGPNLVKQENLVFGFDTGYGVADPGLSTRFYKGKPTTNIASGAAFIHDTASGSAGSTVDAPEKGPGWKKVNITAIGSNFRVIQFGSYPTMTANVLYASSFEADWGNLRGKGYVIVQDGSGGGTRNQFINGNYSTGVTSNIPIDSTLLDGHVGMNIVKSSSHVHVPFLYNSSSTNTSGRNDYFYYKEYQQEVGTIPTPYVSGTRSDTASLIDLTKTANIDVGNVSFDNGTGLVEFDGSDDFIDTPFTRATLGNQLTMIAWYKFTGSTGRTYTPLFGGKESGAGTEFFIGKNSGNTSIGVQDGNYIGGFVTGSNAWDGNYHQMVYTYDNGSGKIYLDGVLKNTGSFTKCNDAESITIGSEQEGSGYYMIGDIQRASIYNTVLSEADVVKNFNTYRNRFNI